MKSEKIPFVSIIIVTFNGLGALRGCLKSLSEIDYPKNRKEVIVLDNASSDGTAEWVRKNYPSVKVIASEKNLGYVGINLAIKYCKGKYVYFTNNDITMNKGCIKNLVDAAESDKKIAMAAHTVINFYNRKLVSGGTWASRAMYAGHYEKKGNDKFVEIPYMGGGLIKKSFVDKYGYLFDKDYFIYAEDLDLGLRIRLAGMKTVMVADAINYHMHAMAMKQYSTPSKNTFLLERNLLMTFFKIFSFKNVLLMFPYILGVRIIITIKDLVFLRAGNAMARMRAFFWIVWNFGIVIKKRREVQRRRVMKDSYVLNSFSEEHLFKKPFIV